jgi:hypothetical protein
VNVTNFGPINGLGTFKAWVPGTPDCRLGFDGAVAADGDNCPYQMWAIFGNLTIKIAGTYTFCTVTGDG